MAVRVALWLNVTPVLSDAPLSEYEEKSASFCIEVSYCAH
jgi:hypothetical protein